MRRCPPPALPMVPPYRAPTSCLLYWASKLLRGTFLGAPLSFQSPASSFRRAFEPQSPPQQLAKASPPAFAMVPPYRASTSCLSIGLRNCYVARFWAPLKSLKKPRSSFRRPLNRKNPSAAACEGLPLALPWVTSPRAPTSCFLLGFETATWHVFAHPLTSPQKPPQPPPKKGGRRHPGASPILYEIFMWEFMGCYWIFTGSD